MQSRVSHIEAGSSILCDAIFREKDLQESRFPPPYDGYISHEETLLY